MPFDDVIKLDGRLTENDFDKLDQLAANAQKKLEKIQYDRQKAGGVYQNIEKTEKDIKKKTLPKGFEEKGPELFAGRFKVGQKIGKIGAPIKRDSFKQQVEKGVLAKLAEQDYPSTARDITGFFTDPVGTIKKTMTDFLPELAGIITFIQVVQDAIEKLTEPGMPLDIYFKDNINTFIDAFRNKFTTASIQAGLTQEIITTQSGSISPRNAYNTYQMFNNDRRELQYQFTVRRPQGF